MPILVSPGEDNNDPGIIDTRKRIVMRWDGVDGSSWHILSTSSGAVLEGRDVRGLSMPDWDIWTSQAPGLAGSRHRGSRAREREVFWQMLLHADSSDDFVAVDSAFFRSVDPDREGVWTVTTPAGTRSLRLRLREVTQVMPTDPVMARMQSYGVYFTASQPFWEGAEIGRRWVAEEPQPFFMTSGGVFYISASNTLGSAALDNPGDEPAWPVWTITGPCDTAEVGVDGHIIEIPFEIDAGEWLRIDSRPDRRTATDQAGADRIGDLGAVSWGRILPGESVPVSIDATGTGSGFSISATITPLYRRAW